MVSKWFQSGFKHLFRGLVLGFGKWLGHEYICQELELQVFQAFLKVAPSKTWGPQVFLSFLSFSFPLALPSLLLFLFLSSSISSSFPLPFLFLLSVGKPITPQRERERARLHSLIITLQVLLSGVSKWFPCLGGLVLRFGKRLGH